MIPRKESIKLLEAIKSDVSKIKDRLPQPLVNYVFMKITDDPEKQLEQAEQWTLAVRTIASIFIRTISSMAGKDYYNYTIKDLDQTLDTVLEKLKEKEDDSPIFLIFGDSRAGNA